MPKLNLNGQQWADLSAAIQSGLPAPFDLQQMLQFKLNKNLTTYAPVGTAYPQIVFAVIQYAEAQGWTAQLVAALRETVPENPLAFGFSQDVALSSTPRQLERKIRDNSPFFDLVPFRTRLATLEAQICRIEIPIPGQKPFYGTGLLLGPSVVMTNYHVMEPVISGKVGPEVVNCLFDYKQLNSTIVNQGTAYKLKTPNWLIDASKPSAVDEMTDPGAQVPNTDELDYAAVRLDLAPGSSAIGNAVPGVAPTTRGWITPPLMPAEPQGGDPLFVLQHPEARPLQLALEMDGVLTTNANGTRVRHKVNTEPGSSGSPCFNKSFELVALHHSGDPNFFHHATYNEAIPFSKIVALITVHGKKQDVFGP